MTPTPPEVVPAQVGGVVVMREDRSRAAPYLGFAFRRCLEGECDSNDLVQAFARHRLATIEECAKVIKDMAESARYREQIGSDDMQVEHGAAADALCEAYAAIRQLSAPPPPPVDVGEGG